jgi:hypothetical protein
MAPDAPVSPGSTRGCAQRRIAGDIAVCQRFTAAVEENALNSTGETSQYPELNQIFSTYAVNRSPVRTCDTLRSRVEERLNDRMRLHVEFYNRQDSRILARPALDPDWSPPDRISSLSMPSRRRRC